MFKLLISRNFLFIHLLLGLIYIILEYYYYFFISVQFDYLGFVKNVSFLKYLESKILYLILLYISFFIFNKSKFLFSVYVLLLLFFFIPNAVMYSFSNIERGPVYSNFMFVTIFFIVTRIKISIVHIPIPKKYTRILLVSIAIVLALPIFIVYKFNINVNTLLLKDIYTTRTSFSLKETALNKYIYNWEVKAIIPSLLVFLLIHKKQLQALFVFCLLIYLFLISGNKIVYMTSIITLFFYFIGNNYESKIRFFLIGILMMLIVLPIIDLFILNSYLLRGTIVMRTFYFPALLNHCYFDYFKDISLFFSENNPFSLFLKSPLNEKSAILISKVYFDNSDMYANNGLVSDGFMNLGYLGVILLSMLFSLIFLFFNSIQLSSKYFGVFLAYVFLFLSLPTFTVIMTGGIWIFALIAFLILRDRT
jgi:hypothetical protein